MYSIEAAPPGERGSIDDLPNLNALIEVSRRTRLKT
jgi:hypothetical protein